jgi:glucose-6-phosphate 1-dehydrogenase
LAKKEIYPSLFSLFRDGLLPEKFAILGYARSDINIDKYLLDDKVTREMKLESEKDLATYKKFAENNFYMRGSYENEDDFQALNGRILEICSEEYIADDCNRIFYLAVPPSIYVSLSKNLAKYCKSSSTDYYTRLVLEKPFGRDLKSSNDLSEHLDSLFSEEQIYRMDHFLGKEMIQSVLVLRFANEIFRKVWSADSIECCLIDLKESFGAEGRGGYFDENGIIRDVMQNHLLQVLTLLTMEDPCCTSCEKIRDKKVEVLKCIPAIRLENVVLGQYVCSGKHGGYVDDETVPGDSMTPTFATTVLFVDNERWRGVPFIIRAGKGLNETKTEVRIQFKKQSKEIATMSGCSSRNELTLRIKPDEAIYLKISTKRPGLNFVSEETTLDLLYKEKYANVYLPEAYQRLLLDVIQGNQLNFVRNDELIEAWRIFTPLLHRIEKENIKPIEYEYGSPSVPESDLLCEKVGRFSFCFENRNED